MDGFLGVGEMTVVARDEHPLDPQDLPVVETAERRGDLLLDRPRRGSPHRVADGGVELGALNGGEGLGERAGHQAAASPAT